MAKDLGDDQALADYYTFYFLSNAVVHATPFGVRTNMTDDSTFQFEPDAHLATLALGYGSHYLLKLSLEFSTQFGFKCEDSLNALYDELTRIHDSTG